MPLTRMVAVNNPGGAALLYNAASTASWLTVTPASGTAPAGSPTMMRLRVNPAGLDPGTYTAQVTLSSSGVASPAPLQVTLSISFGSQLLSAEPSGLTFTAVQGGAAPLPQRLYITGAAANTFFWEASASTLSGGDWLSVDPPSDASRPDSPSAAQVRVNTSSLAPGIYFGELRVSSPGADNSPRLVNVALQVLPQASAVNTIQPGGMIFTGAATRQTIRVRNLGATATTVNFAVAGDTNIFTVTTAEGRNIGPGQERAFDVVATPAGLTAGVYRARIHFQFGNEPQIRAVDAVLVAAEAATCTPTRLLPMVMNQATPFAMTIGLPLPLEVQVVDDCGNPMAAGGSVTIAGNPAAAGTAALRYVQNGLWAGAWPARGGPVGLTFTADDPSRNLQGTVTLGGSGSTSANIPVIAEGGLVSAASLQAGGPLAPGGLISAFGANFVDGQWIPPALPLPSVLGNSRLMMSGADTALFYAGAGQMNAQLPYDAPPNVVRQFAVQSGTRRSHYVEMPVALAQPGVFTFDQSGKGQAIVVDGANPALIATPANPVARGGVAVIYAEGLGAVNQPVVAGTAAPVDPLARVVNTMAVTIGGRPAQVLFAGLTPGFTGLYQVNVTVPADAAPGNAVPVVVTVGGQASNAVTMAVR
ncbi:MAG: hypothetical protein JSR81_16195 [Proteobacteria bacterium]|nr:hypothetical protein [Pseudomonadota bacterium]